MKLNSIGPNSDEVDIPECELPVNTVVYELVLLECQNDLERVILVVELYQRF